MKPKGIVIVALTAMLTINTGGLFLDFNIYWLIPLVNLICLVVVGKSVRKEMK